MKRIILVLALTLTVMSCQKNKEDRCRIIETQLLDAHENEAEAHMNKMNSQYNSNEYIQYQNQENYWDEIGDNLGQEWLDNDCECVLKSESLIAEPDNGICDE